MKLGHFWLMEGQGRTFTSPHMNIVASLDEFDGGGVEEGGRERDVDVCAVVKDAKRAKHRRMMVTKGSGQGSVMAGVLVLG